MLNKLSKIIKKDLGCIILAIAVFSSSGCYTKQDKEAGLYLIDHAPKKELVTFIEKWDNRHGPALPKLPSEKRYDLIKGIEHEEINYHFHSSIQEFPEELGRLAREDKEMQKYLPKELWLPIKE